MWVPLHCVVFSLTEIWSQSRLSLTTPPVGESLLTPPPADECFYLFNAGENVALGEKKKHQRMIFICFFLFVWEDFLQKAVMFSAVSWPRTSFLERLETFKFHKPQIFLVDLGGSGPWEEEEEKNKTVSHFRLFSLAASCEFFFFSECRPEEMYTTQYTVHTVLLLLLLYLIFNFINNRISQKLPKKKNLNFGPVSEWPMSQLRSATQRLWPLL